MSEKAKTSSTKYLDLFGGDKPWSPVDWTDSDDRVRGGKSRSFLSADPFEPYARFYGDLDIDTLGGAGFASQRTTAEEKDWDLSKYDGIAIEITDFDSKQYTLIIKDTLQPPDPSTGREQATINYEYNFKVDEDKKVWEDRGRQPIVIQAPWDAFTATYRGKEQKDADPLNTRRIKRYSLMMRSFFASQKGSFSLSVRRISAYNTPKSFIEKAMRSTVIFPLALIGGTVVLTSTIALLIRVAGFGPQA